jgi:hypothetical protein
MYRLRAAAFAVVMTAAVFGIALLGVGWLLGLHSFWDTLTARWFPAAAVVFNGCVTSILVIFLVVRRKRDERAAEKNDQALRSASQRLQRTGPRF